MSDRGSGAQHTTHLAVTFHMSDRGSGAQHTTHLAVTLYRSDIQSTAKVISGHITTHHIINTLEMDYCKQTAEYLHTPH